MAKLKTNHTRSWRLIGQYGMTFKEYRKLFIKQDRKCAICLQPSKNPSLVIDQKLDLAVDHCHVTGKVRGLLCFQCNTGLGCFRDNPESMRRAIEYLIQSKDAVPVTRRGRRQANKERKQAVQVKGISTPI